MSSITVGLDRNGQVIRAQRDGSVVLRLPENPTTGVRWGFEQLDGPAQLASDRYEQQNNGGVGAAATRVLTLQLKGPGDVIVKLKRWQEWEGDASADATFACTLRVE